jgi:hypothetical protein
LYQRPATAYNALSPRRAGGDALVQVAHQLGLSDPERGDCSHAGHQLAVLIHVVAEGDNSEPAAIAHDAVAAECHPLADGGLL